MTVDVTVEIAAVRVAEAAATLLTESRVCGNLSLSRRSELEFGSSLINDLTMLDARSACR